MTTPPRPSRPFPALLLSLLLAACGHTPHHVAPVQEAGARPQPPRTESPRVMPVPGDRTGEVVAEQALNLVGSPYRYGGTDPRGFDCSGLVTYAYARSGIDVPRTADDQYRYARRVPPGQLQPGDLVFFDLPRRRDLHVGIYTGRGRFIHAPGSRKRVRGASLYDAYWSAYFVGAGRYRR